MDRITTKVEPRGKIELLTNLYLIVIGFGMLFFLACNVLVPTMKNENGECYSQAASVHGAVDMGMSCMYVPYSTISCAARWR